MDKEQIIQSPVGLKPHVVLLGAGASMVSFPCGDANGNRLPVMNNLIEIVHLEEILKKHHLNPTVNFEKIYRLINIL
ncbi:hypothetical protein [Legionella cincinnatiensis]|nr:hypothetical protein [Legionella cincinnatiensis]